MPAYNAEKTLHQTGRASHDVIDEVVLVDDASRDSTVQMARSSEFEPCTSTEQGLRRQSEDMLPGSFETWRGCCGHDPPTTSIRPDW
jgi:hypothetical protein